MCRERRGKGGKSLDVNVKEEMEENGDLAFFKS